MARKKTETYGDVKQYTPTEIAEIVKTGFLGKPQKKVVFTRFTNLLKQVEG